jgi:hypothetical protein
MKAASGYVGGAERGRRASLNRAAAYSDSIASEHSSR